MTDFDSFYSVSICVDCLFAHANGEVEGPTDREPLNRLTAGESLALGDDEGSFSWSPCDTCGSTLGGDRYDATVFVSTSHTTEGR